MSKLIKKSNFKRLKKIFIKNKVEIIFVFLLLVLSAIVRFYNLDKLAFFAYDQARDALYIKRIIVDHTLRLISTQCSGVPGLYNGPIYYYLMVPFLWLFKLNPIGVDFGVALFGVFAVFVFYFLAKNLTGNFFIAWLAAMIFSFQPQVVLQSRFGWNPNLLPLFSLIFIFGLWLLKKGKNWSWLLVFISLAIMLHLHYSSVCFLPILFLWLFVSRKKIKFGSYFLSSLILFLVLMSPLLLFDIRHNFINTKAVWLYFQQGPSLIKAPPPPFFAGLLEKLEYILPQMVFGIRHKLLSFLLIFILFLATFFIYKNYKKFKDSLFLLFSWLILGVLFVSFYRGSFYSYYLTFLYPVGFLITAVLANFFWRKGRLVRVLLIFLFISIFINNYGRLGVFKPPLRTIEDLKSEAQIIAQDAPQDKPFNLATALEDERFGHNAVDYRYFLETFYGKKALDWEPTDYQQAEILYLVNEKKLADPLHVTIMEVQEFQPGKILEVWELPSNRVIYKLGK